MTTYEGVWVSDQTADVVPISFDAYVRASSVSLLKFAFLVTRDREDAHDAVQDALLGLFPRWTQVSRNGGVDAYVRRSIVNAHVSRWRKTRRLVPAEEPDVLPQAPVAEDPAARVAAADEALRLCGSLPPLQRAAVVLRFYEDRSFAEIADILGCPEATARSHVHRALASLRTRLEANR
ncbi:MAG: SigE family RNA polymerase sigma factor [Propionicimonas sp.]|uniref:SigE family RNA polymerase sigma factor n=1 Tax=Propionicimonas sp. TaxID=1955623 RepID=UPI002B1FF9D7|nr:SigE family RNA polymerase sigma factor [Propionicimonas sp.]MEA4945890.1 SigE family RNA polymerase sigma factor [Propionicimonas sp.]MEA5051816.1 SigE family RNA polymerase sigma factor [Propionicimonas sp.]MEA5117703.1 SigE family RNA polymerase sigma factor [Propionicimonas sp.]